MSTFVNSQPTRPRFESRPYRPSPARREHIYGRIKPTESPLLTTSTKACVRIALFCAALFAIQMMRML